MSTADPNEFPSAPPPTPPAKEPSPTAAFLGCLILDGTVQLGMTFWSGWLLKTIAAIQFNFWLFWLGSTMFYLVLHWHDVLTSGRVLVWHAIIFLLTTIYIWIFL